LPAFKGPITQTLTTTSAVMSCKGVCKPFRVTDKLGAGLARKCVGYFFSTTRQQCSNISNNTLSQSYGNSASLHLGSQTPH
jgi:hypothetical protein